MSKQSRRRLPRREFVKSSVKGVIGSSLLVWGFPAIVPASVFGQKASSNRINVGAIGNGRISRVHDLPGTWKFDSAQIVAVCDLDSKRVEDAKKLINDYYSKKTGKTYDGVIGYSDYRELLKNKDVDAVLVSTPDHWHAIVAAHAVEAGKDVYLQKPASLTIAEGRALSNTVQRTGRILQVGSQQRSEFNSKTGLYGNPARYYDQNLTLFGLGIKQRQFWFDSQGNLKLAWRKTKAI